MTIADQLDTYLLAQLKKILKGHSIILFGGSTWVFRTNSGRLVSKQLEYTEVPDDLPQIIFYSDKHTATTEGAELGSELHTQPYSIEGLIESDKAGNEGDDLRLDITAAVKSDPWWGGLIWEITNFETDTAPQVGDRIFTIVSIKFSVTYSALYGAE